MIKKKGQEHSFPNLKIYFSKILIKKFTHQIQDFMKITYKTNLKNRFLVII